MADQIQTTHAGSLPRPDDLTRLMWDSIDGKPVDWEAFFNVGGQYPSAVLIMPESEEAGAPVLA